MNHLLITKDFGPRVRMTAILTDASLETEKEAGNNEKESEKESAVLRVPFLQMGKLTGISAQTICLICWED